MRWNVAVATLAASWGLIAVIVRKVDLDAQVLTFYRSKSIAARVPVLALSFWYYAIATVAVAPLLAGADRLLPTARELPAVLALGVVFTAVSGYLYIWFLRHVTAQTIGVLAYIEPISAALLAWAFLAEALTWQMVAGGALVIPAGATVVLLEPADAAAPEAAPVAPG